MNGFLVDGVADDLAPLEGSLTDTRSIFRAPSNES